MKTNRCADTQRSNLEAFYSAVKQAVVDAGYNTERDWQERKLGVPHRETDFLREGAWVILCSGFREQYVRRIFDFISLCFCDWESAAAIVEKRTICETTACVALNNQRKMRAITTMAQMIGEIGFSQVNDQLKTSPINYLQTFPMIGPVTAYHLAKNLGISVAKPDRHLVRIASMFGYSSVHEFCDDLSKCSGEDVAVIDITVWRYGTLGLA